MAIPEAQLKTWSAIGSVQQSAATYETISNVLNDSAAPYHAKDFSIFLQGSYGNKTNVIRDSDVDIVICLDETYYADTSKLGDGGKASYEKARVPATYGIDEFKGAVLAWLQKKYGADAKEGKKAIFIKGSGARRNADVLVCAKHRRFREGSTGTDDNYDEGICFWSGTTQIVNFPKQHADNCTDKHQDSDEWFKPVVRVYKNMRNRMIEDGVIKEGLAPSYFLEGMLWNVPAAHFGGSYGDSFCNTFNWVVEADKNKLACANDLFWLVRDNVHNCWPTANFDAYLAAVRKYWDDWK